jgi:anti-sigma regulatory factor (Ser/Thr protein kinase)
VERGGLATLKRHWAYASADARAALEARLAFCRPLRDIGCSPRFIAEAQVVFGELVGNVVRHAPGPIDISLTWRGDVATIAVADRGAPFSARTALPDDPLAEGGRGLFIVRSIARTLSIEPLAAGGKAIRVSLQCGSSQQALAF